MDVDGEEMELPARIADMGFIRRYLVTIGEHEYSFEHDDAGELRAILRTEDAVVLNKREQSILKAAAASLNALFS
ncbi:MAG: hypothetical protein EOO04_16910 [Chitinophagaceae bacterium]|nr:MAG: hypothetical protein EOO04_16910 [Chitinophagaceae bacterium]